MSDARLQAALTALDEEEQTITQAIGGLRARLEQVQAARDALLVLRADEPVSFDGKLVDACRTVLRKRAGQSASPTEIRDAVKVLGYDFTRHDNPMAAVHGVLKSLVDQDEIKTKIWKGHPGTRYYYPEPAHTSAHRAIMLIAGETPEEYANKTLHETVMQRARERLKDGEK
jgi:hypothetical protein